MKARAKTNHRSLNKEVIATLHRAANQVHKRVPEQIEEARRTRRLFNGTATLKEIQAFKVAGRLLRAFPAIAISLAEFGDR
jgi:hypothetical protein